MKYNSLFKKLAAGATTVAMLASLGVTALAHNYNVTGGLTINSVSATYTENGTVKNYTITVKYSGVTTEDQVTVLGYIFDNPTDTATDLEATNITDDSIHAVNQEEGSGTTIIKLSSEGEKAVTGEETLIIKMGTDNDSYTAAQAVSINLASATEQKADLVVNADPASVNATVAYGDGKTALMGQLPDFVTVVGTRDEASATENVGVVWNVDEAWVANNLNGMTVTGTLQETTGVVLGSHTTVTANVTVNPLTTADVVAPAAIEVAKDGGAAAVAAKVGKVTVKSGDITDTYTIDAADVTVDTTAEGTVDATIVIKGESDNKIFNLTDKSTTVSVTVTEKPAGPTNYGDINNTGAVDIADVALAFNHAFNIEMLSDEQFILADVNGTGAVDIADVALIFNRAFMADLYPGEVGKPFTELQK